MPPHARILLLTALAVGLLLPGSAMASSIAFIQDNNVWLTSPDGSRQKQVTSDGTEARAYNWPTQADDGTILAKYGDLFVRVRPDGTKLGEPIPAVGSDIRHSGSMTVMAGPAEPKISPDGTRFAYWISARNLDTCPVWTPGCSYSDTDMAIVSHVDRFTDPSEFGGVRSYRDPSWIGNDRLLVFNHGLGVKEAAISPVGAGEPGLLQWFDPPPGIPQIGTGEMSRQGDKLVALAGSSIAGAQESVYLYGVAAPYPAAPEAKCVITEGAPPSGKFMQPSWSPDGAAVALLESDGIHIFENIPDLRAPSPNCGQITDRLLVRGSAPGWGPADVPNGAGAQPGGPGRPPASAMTALTVAKRQTGRAVRVRVGVATAGSTVKVRLLGKRRRLMGAATRRNAKAGTLTLEVKLNRSGRKALSRTRKLNLTVRVSVTGPGGEPTQTTRQTTLRR